MIGGGQENGLRSGSENIPAVVGMKKAVEIMQQEMNKEVEKFRGYRDILIKNIPEKIPAAYLNGHPTERLPNNVHFRFEGIEGEALLLSLKDKGISISTGSACTSGSLEPSHVLRAMGVPFTAAHGSIRFSLSVYNSEEDVDYIIEHMPGIIADLRAMSPFWEEALKEEAGTGGCGCNCK